MFLQIEMSVVQAGAHGPPTGLATTSMIVNVHFLFFILLISVSLLFVFTFLRKGDVDICFTIEHLLMCVVRVPCFITPH